MAFDLMAITNEPMVRVKFLSSSPSSHKVGQKNTYFGITIVSV
jgi:hypothetical protein